MPARPPGAGRSACTRPGSACSDAWASPASCWRPAAGAAGRALGAPRAPSASSTSCARRRPAVRAHRPAAVTEARCARRSRAADPAALVAGGPGRGRRRTDGVIVVGARRRRRRAVAGAPPLVVGCDGRDGVVRGALGVGRRGGRRTPTATRWPTCPRARSRLRRRGLDRPARAASSRGSRCRGACGAGWSGRPRRRAADGAARPAAPRAAPGGWRERARRIGAPLAATGGAALAPSAWSAGSADRFAVGRVALVGDAAHVVSPIGGQGMNLGWLDAAAIAAALDAGLGRAEPTGRGSPPRWRRRSPTPPRRPPRHRPRGRHTALGRPARAGVPRPCATRSLARYLRRPWSGVALAPLHDGRARRRSAARPWRHPWVRHLRLPFNLFLTPLFFWGAWWAPRPAASPPSRCAWRSPSSRLHVFLYGGTNALNSYYDRDEGPIGGMFAPPPVDPGLLRWAWAVQLAGLPLAAWVGGPFLVVWLALLGVATAYSHPATRWKARPVAALRGGRARPGRPRGAGGRLAVRDGWVGRVGDSGRRRRRSACWCRLPGPRAVRGRASLPDGRGPPPRRPHLAGPVGRAAHRRWATLVSGLGGALLLRRSPVGSVAARGARLGWRPAVRRLPVAVAAGSGVGRRASTRATSRNFRRAMRCSVPGRRPDVDLLVARWLRRVRAVPGAGPRARGRGRDRMRQGPRSARRRAPVVHHGATPPTYRNK